MDALKLDAKYEPAIERENVRGNGIPWLDVLHTLANMNRIHIGTYNKPLMGRSIKSKEFNIVQETGW